MRQLLIALATMTGFAACTSQAGTHAPDTAIAIEKAKKQTIDSMNAIQSVKQHVVDSMSALNRGQERRNTASHRNSSTGYNANTYNEPNAAPVASTTAATPVAKKKKGWSHTAKGAVVGAGTGAITGAIINKNHAQGAIIGTLIGAGVGAGTGAIVDHVKKKKGQQ